MAVTGEFDASIRAVLTALRRPRSERQLTDTIAAFASLDSRFSANVARVLVEAVNPSRATSLGEVPAELQVSSEVVWRGSIVSPAQIWRRRSTSLKQR